MANYITNPRFETNTTGWAAGGAGVTIARDTVVFDEGAASLRVDVPSPGTSSDRAEYAITLTAGDEYIFRGRLRGPAGVNTRLWVVDGTAASLGQTAITGDGTFHSYEVRFTATANNTHKLRFGRVSTGAIGSFYGDQFQLIRVADGTDLMSYRDGSMPGYAWSGTTDASTTVQTGWLEVADPTDFELEGGQLAIGTEIVNYVSADENTGLIELPGANNGIKNPSFEVDLARWSSASTGTTTRTRDTTESWSGVASQKCVTDGTAAGQGAAYNDSNLGVRVNPGETWTASGYFKQAAGGMSAGITIEYKTAADVSLGVQSGPTSVLIAGRWHRLQATAIAPAGAYKAYIRFINVNASVVTFFLDATLFELGSAPSKYADTLLAGTYAQEDPVYVYPLSVERVAHLTEADVALEDEDTMEARVPHALYDKLPTGLRDIGEGEAVNADYDGDEFVVTDLLGQEPAVDASFLSPGTFTVPPSDGIPPTSSPVPTIVGGVRSLFVKWTPIVNNDSVTYEVHIIDETTRAGNAAWVTSGSTYAGELKGSMFQVRTLPGTSNAPSYGTNYYAKIIAFDDDGAAPASAEAVGQPAGADGALGDIVANGVTADNIIANDAMFARLQALLIITNTLQTAESGQRVEIDTDGIRLISSAEQVLVDIPTDPTASPTFQGNVITGGLVVTGNALLRGTDNVLDQGAAITMLAATGSPTTAPTLSHDWDTFTFTAPAAGYGPRTYGLHYDASGFGAQPTFLMVSIPNTSFLPSTYNIHERKVSDGTTVRDATSPSNNQATAVGVCRIGTAVWVLATDGSTGDWYLHKHLQSDLSYVSSVNISSNLPSYSYGPVIGTDGTDILLLVDEPLSGGFRCEVRRFNATTGAFISSHNTDIEDSGILPLGITQVGSQLWLAYKPDSSSTGARFEAISNSTYQRVVDTQHNMPFSGYGIAHDGTRFWTNRTPASGAMLTKHSTWEWTTENAKYWVGYTWRHDGNNQESTISPRASIDMTGYRGSKIKITRPSLPSANVDRVRIYVLRNATSPATTALLRQDTTYVTSETANPVLMFNYNTLGAAPPITNTFGGAASGIKNTIGQVLVGSNWERYTLLGVPYTKGTSTTLERTLVESANNLPNTVAPLSANEVGAVYEFELAGAYDHGNSGGTLTIRVKIGSSTLESRVIAQPGSAQTVQGWFIRGHLIVKTTGATGTVNGAWLTQFAGAAQQIVARGFNIAGDTTVDLTTTQRVDITAQYSNGVVGNGITVSACKIQRVA